MCLLSVVPQHSLASLLAAPSAACASTIARLSLGTSAPIAGLAALPVTGGGAGSAASGISRALSGAEQRLLASWAMELPQTSTLMQAPMTSQPLPLPPRTAGPLYAAALLPPSAAAASLPQPAMLQLTLGTVDSAGEPCRHLPLLLSSLQELFGVYVMSMATDAQSVTITAVGTPAALALVSDFLLTVGK